MNQKWISLLIVGSLLTGAGGTYAAIQWLDEDLEDTVQSEEKLASSDRSVSTETTKTGNMEKVVRAYQLIKGSYIEEIGDEQLVEGAIQGMLTKLEDPYSVYMNKETAEQFNDMLESSFEGIGAEVSVVDGKIIIVAPFKNSPAEKAGIKPNDQILKVDDKSVEGLNLYQTTLRIRGKKGTTVKLELMRQGLKDPIIVSVKRDDIPQITVHSKMKKEGDKRIGYMEITSFSKDTASDFKKELKKLEEQRD